jgi:hypothetical protein
MAPLIPSNCQVRVSNLRHIRSHLSLQLTNINQAPIDKSNSEEHPNAEVKMRKRHEEEAAEMTRLNKELEYYKHGTAATTQLKRKIEEQARDIKTLKEINHELMVERSMQADCSRMMQKLIGDAKIEKKTLQKFVIDARNETEVMKVRLEDRRKVYNELIRDTHFERSKRMRAEQKLQELLAAQRLSL